MTLASHAQPNKAIKKLRRKTFIMSLSTNPRKMSIARVGITTNPSLNDIRKRSSAPPLNPAVSPTKIAITRDMATDRTATIREPLTA